MSTKSIFSERLNSLMKERGVTQTILSDAVGITKQSISMYANAHRVPDIEIFKKMCDFFNVSADYFLGITDQRTSDIDDKKIHAITGLSCEAIDKLKRFKNILPGILIPELNKLIENEGNPAALSLIEPYKNYTTFNKEQLDGLLEYYKEEASSYPFGEQHFDYCPDFFEGVLLLIGTYLKSTIDENVSLQVDTDNVFIKSIDAQQVVDNILFEGIKGSLDTVRYELDKEFLNNENILINFEDSEEQEE